MQSSIAVPRAWVRALPVTLVTLGAVATDAHGQRRSASAEPPANGAPEASSTSEPQEGAQRGPLREEGVRVRGNAVTPPRSASDAPITIGRMRDIPRANAADMLRLAPGIFLTNGLGEGHAEQVFLRGFDARLGQDIEFSYDGVPVNEPGHPHSHGYADTHSIIPEVVDQLRVLEGPFDPRQGDFAVAGSAQYTLRVRERGARIQYRFGSFGTHRLVGVLAPEGEAPGTFVAAELARSDGFGANRAFERMTVNAGYERRVGTVNVRALATSYLTRYGSAGVLRDDDYRSGRVGFYDTYDATQGGDVTRHSVSVNLDAGSLGATLWGTYRTFRLRENFTGFLLDVQRPGQSPHEQRGDSLEQTNSSFDVGTRAFGKLRTVFNRLPQVLEIGAYGRFVRGDNSQRRMRFGTNIPYATDFEFSPSLANIALYADLDLRPVRWLAIRGGIRVDGYHYDVLDHCATRGSYVRGAPLDTECPSADRSGYRNPETRRGASGLIAQPRATVIFGPFSGVSFALAYGSGSRSADATYLGDGEVAPFAPIQSGEAGVTFNRDRGGWNLSARALGFLTHVDRDLIFDEAQGRNALAKGTTRYGGLAAMRATNSWLDLAMHVTYARATFDETGLLVPYVPALVARLDASVLFPLPIKIRDRHLTISAGTGWSLVSQRPLPLSEKSEPILTGDAQVSLRWQHVELGFFCTNILDARYSWAQYNYVSDFRSQEFPTRIATRHFTAAPPRNVGLMLTIHIGTTASRHGAPTQTEAQRATP
ncbi:MAG: TonB-dependent receptor plug domain-containing protein [Polyangiales bacterium]